MSDIQKAQVWEDGLRTDPEKKSFEWWYFDSNFSDGTTIVITFFTKAPSHPKGPVKPQVQVVVTKPDGQKISSNHYFSPDEFAASKEKCDVKIGSNTISGDLKKYKVHLDLPEISGDFEFDRIAESYSTRAKHPKGPEYFGWFCAIPHGTVRADVTFDDKKHSLKGFGYHDHNWGIVNIQDVCQYWYWGRGNAGDYSIIYTVLVLPKILGGKHAGMFYLAKGEKILIESNALELTKTNIDPPKPKAGHLPTELSFALTAEEINVEFSLSHPKLIESVDPVQPPTGIKKLIDRFMTKPLYVRYNSDLELNVTQHGKTDTQKGTSLYEIMILH